MGLNNAQKYGKFLKRRVSDSIFFHKSDEMHDFGRERQDLRDKVAGKGREQDLGMWTQTENIPLLLKKGWP